MIEARIVVEDPEWDSFGAETMAEIDIEPPKFLVGDSIKSTFIEGIGKVVEIKPRITWMYSVQYDGDPSDVYGDMLTKVHPYDAKTVATKLVDDLMASLQHVPDEHRQAVGHEFAQELFLRSNADNSVAGGLTDIDTDE